MGKECDEFEISTCKCFRNRNMYNNGHLSTADVRIIVDKPLKTKGNYNSHILCLEQICVGF